MPVCRHGLRLVVALVGLVTPGSGSAWADEAFVTEQQGDAITVVDLATDTDVATIFFDFLRAGIAIS